MKNKIVNSFFVFLAVIFFAFVLIKIDYYVFFSFFSKIGFINILFVFCLFLLLYFLKTIRVRLLNKNISLGKLFYITIVHNFFVMLFPFKLGELSYVKKLKEEKVYFTKSASDLFVFRMFDFLILVAFFVLVYIFNKKILNGVSWIPLLIVCITLLIILLQANRISKIIYFFSRKIKLKSLSLVSLKIKEIFDNIFKISKKKIIILCFITILIWIVSSFTWVFVILKLFDMAFIEAFIVSLIVILFSLLPINPPAGVGITQGGWIFGLYLVGVGLDFSLAFSVFAHALYIFIISLLFFIFSVLKRLTY